VKTVLDVDLILDQTDDVAKRLATKGTDPAMVHSARDSIVRRRELRVQLDEARARMNRESKEMGQLVAAKDPTADTRRVELGQLKATISDLEAQVRDAEQVSLDLLLRLPNLPDPQAPCRRRRGGQCRAAIRRARGGADSRASTALGGGRRAGHS